MREAEGKDAHALDILCTDGSSARTQFSALNERMGVDDFARHDCNDPNPCRGQILG